MSVSVLIGLALTFLTALLGYLQSRRNHGKIAENSRQLGEVHVLVNSRLTAVIDRVTVLTAALSDAGVQVPPEAPRP